MMRINTATPLTMPMPAQSAAGPGNLSVNGLPPPTLEALSPGDPMGEMMAILERMNQLSTRQTESELRAAGTKLNKQLDKYLRLVADAIKRARQAQKKKRKKSLFGKIAGAIGSAVGGVVGKVLATVTMSPSLEKKMEGFMRGAMSFSADLAAFNTKLALALATNGADAEAAWEEVKTEAGALFESFQENCLENPDFMEVVGIVAKGGAVAAALASGGALAPVALALIAACELDAQTGFVEDVVGKDAAPWVRVGMHAAAYAALGAAGGEEAIQYLTAGAGILQGASDINAGLKMLEEGKRQAAELLSAAELQATLNRMHAYQRMVDELLVEMEDHGENQNRNRKLSSSVAQIQASTIEAVVLRA